MLNQAAVEALYSATYIENYLDYVENLPDELQRYVTRMRELDLTFHGFLREVEQQRDALVLEKESTAKKKGLLSKVQQALIYAQELGDEKLQILQQVQDVIENKTRQLDLDYRNLADIGKDQDPPESGKDVPAREGNSITVREKDNGNGGERQSKRVRRTRTENIPPNDLNILPEPAAPPGPVAAPPQQTTPSTPAVSAGGGTQKKTGANSIGKKKKRKSRQSAQSANQQSQGSSARDESPPRDEEMAIDPDEPTYCLCEQISYGEMIMCDNDLCPFEWFHFSCVSLGVKPKGKWYCPKCRGDRSSIMKPKAQLMKELERIKKLEKELKEEKGS